MAMGIVSDSDFESEVGKLNGQREEGKSVAIIKDIEKGRGSNNKNVPDGLRKLIGEQSAIEGRASGLELAESFGISPSSVSAYNQGAHSTASYNDRPDLAHINSAKERISKKARNRLVLALNNLTNEKLESAKAKEIASVARDMSAVVKNMEPESPKSNGNGNNGPTFIFYSPQFRREEVFEVVHVKE